MIAKQVLITKEIAEWMMKSNTGNPRKLSMSVAAKYAADMRGGRWGTDATPICFGKDGRLLNGQHRLTAVILSGVACTFLVLYDCESDMVFDQGKTRSTGDILHSHGIGNSNSVGAGVAAFLCSDMGTRVIGNHNVSKQRLLETYQCWPDYFQVAANMPYVKSLGGCSAGYVLLMIAGVPVEDVRDFAKSIGSGEGFKGEPAYMVHHRLRDKERKFPSQVVALVIEAWNRIQMGKKWSRVALPQTGDPIQPVIVGRGKRRSA